MDGFAGVVICGFAIVPGRGIVGIGGIVIAGVPTLGNVRLRGVMVATTGGFPLVGIEITGADGTDTIGFTTVGSVKFVAAMVTIFNGVGAEGTVMTGVGGMVKTGCATLTDTVTLFWVGHGNGMVGRVVSAAWANDMTRSVQIRVAKSASSFIVTRSFTNNIIYLFLW